METKKCPKCGTEIAENQNFCKNCGNNLQTQEISAQTTPMANVEYEVLPRVGFIEAIKLAFTNMSAARARRSEYWWFQLFVGFFVSVLYVCWTAYLLNDSILCLVIAIITGLVCLASIVPAISLTIRRLHDTNRSGGWYFICLVPYVGAIWLFVLTCLDSTKGTNNYGESPKYIVKKSI